MINLRALKITFIKNLRNVLYCHFDVFDAFFAIQNCPSHPLQ